MNADDCHDTNDSRGFIMMLTTYAFGYTFVYKASESLDYF